MNKTKIMFVCHGNICRSPMAEFLCKEMVRRRGMSDRFEIDSSATSREDIGSDTYIETKRQLEKHGIPYTKRAAVQFTAQDYQDYDYIICMDEMNVRNLKRLIGNQAADKISKLLDFGEKGGEIADPWYTRDFERTYAQIKQGLEVFLGRF